MLAIRRPRTSRISRALEVEQVLAIELDAAGHDLRARREQANDRVARGSLTATRLADEAKRLAGLDGEAHSVDGLDDAAAAEAEVMGLQTVDAQQWRHRGRLSLSGCAAVDRDARAANRRAYSPTAPAS